MAEDNISIAWWNTSVSPSSARDRSDENFLFALDLIVKMLLNYKIDIFCLGELSPKNILKVQELFSPLGFLVYDGSFNEGRVKHDLCVLINGGKFQYVYGRSISEQTLHGLIRAGQQIKITHLKSQIDMFIYLSHWPSRSHDAAENTTKRYVLGSTLRSAVKRCIDEEGAEYIILLGDYNDDPFNESITDGIGATRDKNLAIKKEGFLYNPFWRLMGHVRNKVSRKGNTCISGTYYYKSGVMTKWYTFDQIMFSSSFISNKEWSLVEDKVSIILDDDIIDAVIDPNESFDHLPVFAEIEVR